MTRATSIVVVVLVAMLTAASAGVWWFSEAPSGAITGEALGTTYRVALRFTSRAGRHPSMPDALVGAELARVDSSFSTWREDSEIARFNAYDGPDWFPVSKECAALVDESLRISELTRGAFDVTVGPLASLWGFGSEGRTSPPTREQLDDARALIGHARLHARTDPPALRKDHPAMRLDMSAIAKGYAVDRVHLAVASDRPIRASMVEVGGEIRVKGTWRIGIEAPTPEARSVMHKIELTDAALATSGDYRNFIVRDGKRLSHIIDPRTGRPVEHDLASVSVIADTCARADALATAMMVMGPETAAEFAVAHGVKTLLIVRERGGGFRSVRLAGFPE